MTAAPAPASTPCPDWIATLRAALDGFKSTYHRHPTVGEYLAILAGLRA
jgi:hypothetical protein